MNTDVMFSSKTDLWETPQEFFDELDAEYHFTLDAGALPENAKCARYYTPEQDGLHQPWDGIVWCNPPYGREIEKWVERAYCSAVEGGGYCSYVASCENRYTVVSRVHIRQSRDPLCSWSAKIRRKQKQCAVSVNGSGVPA